MGGGSLSGSHSYGLCAWQGGECRKGTWCKDTDNIMWGAREAALACIAVLVEDFSEVGNSEEAFECVAS